MRLPAAIAAATFVMAPVVLGPGLSATPAHAAAFPAADEEILDWSVRPTPTKSEPERPNFSFDVTEGEKIKDEFRVSNYGKQELALKIYSSDALTTPTGGLDLLPAAEKPKDVGNWIQLAVSTLTIPPGNFIDVPFTMRVPNDVESGDHTGGIVTSFTGTEKKDGGDAFTLDRRLGTRVQVRVDGELRPKLEVSGLSTQWAGTANPVGKGSMKVTYTVRNTGNVRMAAEQVVGTKGPLGLGGRQASLEKMPELLPGNKLTLTTSMPGVWPTVHTSASVRLRPVAVRPGDVFGPGVVPAAISKGLWTVPWSTFGLVVLLAGGTAGPTLLRRYRKRGDDPPVDAAVDAELASSGS